MGRRKLTPDEEIALAELHSRLVLTLEYIEEVENFPSGPQMRAIIEKAAAGKDLRTLKLLQPDIQEMTLALSTQQRAALDMRLLQTAAESWDRQRSEAKQEVEALLTRGTVRSERERQRLEAYADMLIASGEVNSDELSAIQRLLATT